MCALPGGDECRMEMRKRRWYTTTRCRGEGKILQALGLGCGSGTVLSTSELGEEKREKKSNRQTLVRVAVVFLSN